MDELNDFSDKRHKAWCIHCSITLNTAKVNKDHVPSKSLLGQPFPANLPAGSRLRRLQHELFRERAVSDRVSGVRPPRNDRPNLHDDTTARRILRWNSSLRASIERARREYRTVGSETRLLWQPEDEKINNVLIKNARGHVYHELGEPIFSEPETVWSKPLEHFNTEDRDEFERSEMPDLWAEIGSRLMTRLLSGLDLDGSWIVVQPGVYRFNIHFVTPIRVRIILREYLAAEITWPD